MPATAGYWTPQTCRRLCDDHSEPNSEYCLDFKASQNASMSTIT